MPTEISTPEELDGMREEPSGDYVLVDDIDMSDFGTFEPFSFSGELDGDYHTIMDIEVGSWTTGSFGEVSTAMFRELSGATIEHLRVDGMTFATGTVEMVSHLAIEINEATTIEQVVIESDQSEYEDGFGHGDLVFEVSDLNGGDNLIRDCAVIADWDDHHSYGGFINTFEDDDGGTIEHCFTVTRNPPDVTEDVGFISNYANGTVSECYWDAESSDIGASDDPESIGLDTAEMQETASEDMDGFDFAETWNERTDDEYPILTPFADSPDDQAEPVEGEGIISSQHNHVRRNSDVRTVTVQSPISNNVTRLGFDTQTED